MAKAPDKGPDKQRRIQQARPTLCPKVEGRCGLCGGCAKSEWGSRARPTLLLLLLPKRRGACTSTAKLRTTRVCRVRSYTAAAVRKALKTITRSQAESGPTWLLLPSKHGACISTSTAKRTTGMKQSGPAAARIFTPKGHGFS